MKNNKVSNDKEVKIIKATKSWKGNKNDTLSSSSGDEWLDDLMKDIQKQADEMRQERVDNNKSLINNCVNDKRW